MRWERDAGTASDGRGTGGAEEEPMEVPLEERRFPEAARSAGTGRRQPAPRSADPGKARCWGRGGAGREGRAKGVEPAASPPGRWETLGGRVSLSAAAGAWQAPSFPARLPHTFPSFFLSRLHRPRLRVTPVPAAGAGAEPTPRRQRHVSRSRATAAAGTSRM